MTTEAAFLAALAEDPTDETTRLVFADWLDERGDPRAAWLRDSNLAAWSLPGLVDPIPRLASAVGESPLARPILLRLGTAVVPRILEAYSAGDSATRDLLLDVLREVADNHPRLRELRQGFAGNSTQREAAIAAVVELGREGLALLPEIAALAQEHQVPDNVLGQLLEKPVVACPAVFRFLWDRAGYENRGMAAVLFHAIEKNGPHPTNVQILLSGLNAGGDLSEAAAGSLRALGLAIVPQLLDSFERADSDSFDGWVGTLTAFGPPVVPLLLDAQDREFTRHGDRVAVSSQAWMGIEKALRELAEEGQLGEHVPTVVDRLTAIARQGPSHIWFVFTTLCSIGPAARPAWPVVEPFLTSPSPHEREAALQFLARLGEPARYAADIALNLQAGDLETRLRASNSIVSLASCDMELAVPLLRQSLTDPDSAVRHRTLDVLMSPTFWATHEVTVPLLQQALADPEESLRTLAVLGLCRHAERAGAVTPDLLRLLREDAAEEVRSYVAGYLILAFPTTRTPEILTALCLATEDPSSRVRDAAMMALRDWGTPLTDSAIHAVIARLRDPATMANATYTLQRQPRLSTEAIAALRELLHGDQPGSVLALQALSARSHPFCSDDIPALERIQREGPAHDRDLATRHLQTITQSPTN